MGNRYLAYAFRSFSLFLPLDTMLAWYVLWPVAVCLSLCLSVCPPVTSQCSIKLAKHVILQRIPYHTLSTLVFLCRIPIGSPTTEVPDKCRVGKSCDFLQITCCILKMAQFLWKANRTWSCVSCIEWWYCQWPWVTLTTSLHHNFYVLNLPSYL